MSTKQHVGTRRLAGCLAVALCAAARADGTSELFKPADDAWLNDPRVVTVGGTHHLYYQKPPRVIGHAVSTDLVSWRDLPGGIGTGPEEAWDGKDICTSGFFWWDGTFHSLYTGRTDAGGERGRYQRIGLATSSDGDRFVKHPDNPVLLPAARWYENDYTAAPNYGNVAWRDPAIWRNPKDGRFYAYITARVNHGPGPRRGCIAVARSADRVSWQCLPPCYAPKAEICHEVPQMVPWPDGRYVLFFGSKRGGYTQMKYVVGRDALRFDDSDDGRLLLGSQVNGKGRAMEYSSWLVRRNGGFDVIHMVYEWSGARLVRGRLALPKRLAGSLEEGLYLSMRDDLRATAADRVRLSELDVPAGWQKAGGGLIAEPDGRRRALRLPGHGPRTIEMDVKLSGEATLGLLLDPRDGQGAVEISVHRDGRVRATTQGVKTDQRWRTPSEEAGTLSFTVVGKYVEAYAGGRYLGVACSARETSSDEVLWVVAGRGRCVVRRVAVRAIRIKHALRGG